jgi:hypothetical protein
MIPERVLHSKLMRLALVMLLALAVGACSGGQVRDESPMVRVSEISHLEGNTNVQLSIRNVNDEALDVRAISYKLTSDDEPFLAWDGPATVNIAAKGTETWSVAIDASASSKALLESLQQGSIKSLPYTLEGSVETVDGGTLRFEAVGYLYPLPGRPGYFR